ncbi:MAG: hypothetical protein MRQ09_00565 [Candidatus Midichloria sp.]|nr:hypothetical protein [Candidatus Midichloria sp.]
MLEIKQEEIKAGADKNERLLKEKEQAIRNRFKTIVTKSIKSIETPSLEQSTAAPYPIRSLINAIEQYEGKFPSQLKIFLKENHSEFFSKLKEMDQKFLLKKSGEETKLENLSGKKLTERLEMLIREMENVQIMVDKMQLTQGSSSSTTEKESHADKHASALEEKRSKRGLGIG